MATWEDVGRLAAALPEAVEKTSYGNPGWAVGGKVFVWQRPLRASDREALAGAAPDGLIVAAYVADVGAKEALLADEPDVYFTTPHFDGYPIVLLHPAEIDPGELKEVVTEAWLARAPARLAAGWGPSSRG